MMVELRRYLCPAPELVGSVCQGKDRPMRCLHKPSLETSFVLCLHWGMCSNPFLGSWSTGIPIVFFIWDSVWVRSPWTDGEN
jgi:hypothetical protein